ncbi:MAG: MFS transporter [Acidimicrobiia bacterium]
MTFSASAARASLGANYWKLWTASVISNFGDGVALVAYPWLASAVTRNPLHIALVGVATRIPWLIFTLPAGVITDRVDRKKLVVTMDVVRSLVTFGVAVVVLANQDLLPSPEQLEGGALPAIANPALLLTTIYVSALLLGMAEVLRDNAAQTLMPAVVEKDQLEKANGRLWGAEMVMNSFVGPPLAGVLLAIAFALPFFIDASTFAVSAAILLLLTGSFRTATTAANVARPSFGAELKEGFRWLWRHPLLRRLAVILGILNALGAGTQAVFVLLGQEILELGASEFGLLLSSGAAGGVLGSLVASRFSARLGSGATLQFSLITGALTSIGIGLTSSAVLVWVMFAITSLGAVMWNVVTVSLRQTIIPDRLLGRVNSVYRFFGWGMMPIGALLGGLLAGSVTKLADRPTGLRAPYIVAGVIQAGISIYALGRLSTARLEVARREAAT